MPFHSPAFFFLMAATYAAYWLAPRRLQHPLLLVSSLAFYYYAGLTDTLLLLFCVVANHFLAFGVDRRRPSRLWVTLAVIFNLGVLGFWKYRGFAASSLNALGWHLSVERPVLPLGISFYLFQLISYQVDLYRREVGREPRFWRLLLYILFFPHHQAGPIMRPAKFLPQFHGEKRWSSALVQAGTCWILVGLVKKVLADQMAGSVDNEFSLAANHILPAAQAWMAALGFGFQIFGDFSGYSDIAVGLGLLLGYRLDVNFKSPYVSTSPSEFWRRWHVTLSEWLRDYLYIGALGGNRSGSARTYANLFLTMVLGGLW